MITCGRVPLSEIELGRMDAEYYRPDLITLSKRISEKANISIRRAGAVIDGSAFYPSIVSDYNLNQEGLPFLRVNEIQKGLLSIDDKTVFLRKEVLDRNRSTIAQCDPGDLIIAKGGNSLGKVALLTNRYPKYSICRDVLVVRTQQLSKISRFYLWMYLHSGPGQSLLLRNASQTGQPHLTFESIARLRIPLISNTEQDKIEANYHATEKALELSHSAYRQAQQLLEVRLGLDKLQFQKPTGYTAQLSETMTCRRFDADYFQVAFRQIHSHLDKVATSPLHKLVTIQKGIEVGSRAYASSGRPFLRVSNIKEKGIEMGASDKFISETLYSSLSSSFQPMVGELLLTKDGTPGVCFAVDEPVDGIISGGIVRLHPHQTKIPIEYLALVINSIACRMQVQQDCSGALILHWRPSSIRRLRIPLLEDKEMKEIADLVTESKLARRKSDELLSQSKSMIEGLIDEAAT